jgi:hypothetical protein
MISEQRMQRRTNNEILPSSQIFRCVFLCVYCEHGTLSIILKSIQTLLWINVWSIITLIKKPTNQVSHQWFQNRECNVEPLMKYFHQVKYSGVYFLCVYCEHGTMIPPSPQPSPFIGKIKRFLNFYWSMPQWIFWEDNISFVVLSCGLTFL